MTFRIGSALLLHAPMNAALLAPLRAVVPAPVRFRLQVAVRQAIYFGHRYACPCCGARLRHLHPMGFDFDVLREKHVIGGGYRLNALCPCCNATDRERLVYLYLTRRTELLDRPSRLLHIAPEPGLRRLLSGRAILDYVSADLLREDVDLQMDVTRIPFPDASFDVILCNHVLEHVPDDRQAMTELFRVIRPGGWAVLQVPISAVLEHTLEDFTVTSAADRERVFGQADHVRIYARDYLDRLRAAGFDVESFDWTLHPEDFGGASNRFALLEAERLFIARRPDRSR